MILPCAVCGRDTWHDRYPPDGMWVCENTAHHLPDDFGYDDGIFSSRSWEEETWEESRPIVEGPSL